MSQKKFNDNCGRQNETIVPHTERNTTINEGTGPRKPNIIK